MPRYVIERDIPEISSLNQQDFRDITGHYSRPVIFKLHKNMQPQSPTVFK